MVCSSRFLRLIALLAAAAPAVLAQSGANTGIAGLVLDPTGSAISGASIKILEPSTGRKRTAETDETGAFETRHLSVGEYQLTVEATGFQTLTREGVRVTTDEVSSLTLELELGQETIEVTVVADAEMVNRGSAAIVRELDARELEMLPTSSRNFTQLLLIEPGVDANLSSLLSNNNANVSPSVNGARATSNSFSFNGVDATNLLCCNSRINLERGTLDRGAGSLSRNIAPAPETLAEVKLATSLYDVSTGRNGGGAFQLVSKSGSNDVHGTAYYFNQNDALMSNEFFFKEAGLDKQRLSRHEGGFTIGGPIVKNKTFFYGSYQRTDADTAYVDEASNTVRVPQALGDDRSMTGIANLAGAVEANLTALNPISLQLLQAQFDDGTYLIPSGSNGRNCEEDDVAVSCQVASVLPATFKQDQFSANLDQNFTNNRLSGKFFFADQPSRDPLTTSDSLTRFEEEEDTRQRVFSVTDTHIFTPRIINEVRGGMFFNTNDTVPVSFFTNAQFGIDNPRAAERPELAVIIIEPEDVGSDLVFGSPENRVTDEQITSTIADTLSIQAGKHFLKMGGMFRHHRLNGDYQETRNVEFVIESWQQFLTVGEPDGEDDGEQIAGSSISYGETFRQFRMNDFALFLGDDWKVNTKLTLNLGVRWELFAWPTEKNGLISNYDLSRVGPDNNIADGYVFASNYTRGTLADDDGIQLASTKSTLAGQDYNNIAPRFGFAYSPFANRGIVVRGGYGLFYDRPTGGFINVLRRSPPFFREREFDDTSDWNDIPNDAPTFPLPDFQIGFDDGEPFLASAAEPDREFEALESNFIDPNLKTPYVQQWNFTIQTPITENIIGDIGYVGTKGTRLFQAVNLNRPLDINASGFLPRPGVPGGGFSSNYFEIVDDEFVPTAGPTCDVLDDFEDCTIASELRSRLLGFDEDEGLNAVTSDSNSIYHALQASLQQRYSAGLSYKINYTFSKAIDYFSDEGLFQVQHDQSRLFLNRAPADFDRKHRMILSFSYDLATTGKRWLDGWSISGIGTVQSSRPFSIVDDADFSGFLFAPDAPRPNLVDGATYDDLPTPGSAKDRVGEYFRTDLIESSGANFGNIGRNILRAPWQRRLDLSFSKITRITEDTSLELRIEGYNITNTPSFRAPQGNLDEGDFGEITETIGGPRVFQLGVKLRF